MTVFVTDLLQLSIHILKHCVCYQSLLQSMGSEHTRPIRVSTITNLVKCV